MKTKHLQKICIGSVYAALISVVFFLLPLCAKAQGNIEVECTTPQTPDIELVCSGNEVKITVTITNVGITPETDVVAVISPEAGLTEIGYTVDPVGGIEYDADLDLWIIDEIAAETAVTLVLTYMTVNTGTIPITLTHLVEIIEIAGSPVDDLGDEVYVKVFPTPHLDIVLNKAYCSNTAIGEFEFSGSFPGANYQWTKIGGDYIGNLPNSGTGSMPPFTTIENNTGTVLTAYYQVVVSYNHNEILCGGETQEFSIGVMPNPTVINLQDFVYCHTDYVEIPLFDGVAITWKWEKINGQNIGAPGNSGEGNFPSFFAENLGSTPITAFYEVTPYYITEGVSCKGDPGYFAITVNPQPFLNTVPAEMVYCNKSQVPAYNFSGTSDAVPHWEFVGGEPISGVPNSGTGPFPSFVAINDTDDMITTTFKAWAEYKNSDGSVCASDKQLFNIIVLPTATIDINALLTEFCHNENVPAQHFKSNIPGTSLLYVQNEWKYVGGDNVGLSSVYGINTIPSFYAKNSGDTPLVAQYQVTTFVEYNGKSCEGVTYNFSLTVNPEVVFTSVYDAGAVCPGDDFYYVATTNVSGITLTWERPAIAGINGGVAGSGSGSIINETLTNTTHVPIVVAYHFTMTGKCAPDKAIVITVTVMPNAVADIELLQTAIEGCNTEKEVQICYNAQEGVGYEYKLTFADDVFPSMSDFIALPENCLSVLMPADVAAGAYSGQLTIRGGIGCDGSNVEKGYPLTIIVNQGTVIVGDLEDAAICIGSDLILTVDAIGCNLTYTWYHDGIVISETTTGVYIKEKASPDDAGEYYVVITGCCAPVASHVATVGGLIVGQKWNDILYVDNSGGNHNNRTYQWCRVLDDGSREPIRGATSQYYSEQPLYGTYMVEVMDALGNIMFESCEFTPIVTTKNTIRIYPSPVEQHGMLMVEMDMDPEQISGSRIDVYDMVGKLSRTVVVDGRTTTITMQIVPGSYVVRITNVSGEIMKSEKVIVR